MALYHIQHRTHFQYDGPARESVMELRMRPRDGAAQVCREFNLAIAPAAPLRHYVDHHGNHVHYFTLPAPHDSLEIRAESFVEFSASRTSGRSSAEWRDVAALRRNRANIPYLAESRFARSSPALNAFAAEALPDKSLAPAAWLLALRDRLAELIRYLPESTKADSPIDHCIAQRAGVCQDFAHLFIALVRPLGFPARYVSGHLFHRDEHADSGEDATHAWAEAFVPDLGWLGFDPSNRVDVADRHIRVAVGLDYHDVPPTRGVYRGPANSRHDVSVRVRRDEPAANARELVNVDLFQCNVRQAPQGLVVQLVGTLGPADAETLEQKLLPALAAAPARVVLDLSSLEMMGSAGVGALLRIQRRTQAAGGKVVLAAVPDTIRKILEFAQLNRIFTTSHAVEAALKD